MAAVEIHSCNCKHEYQDRLYGEGQRVFNVAEKKKSPSGNGTQRTCTVCGTPKR